LAGYVLAQGQKYRQNGGMTICIIHTGGTIAMRAGPYGLAPAEGVLEAGLAALGDIGAYDLVHLRPPIDSANARFEDWNKIGEIIAADIGTHLGSGQNRYTGFVITHGTDTLAFTAAALSFALIGLTRPVVVTGAMQPLEAAGTDALDNLRGAVAAARSAPAGVWVYFAGKLMHGARVRKAHSMDMDAFTAAPSSTAARRDGLFDFQPYGNPDIGVLTMAPNQSPRALAAMLAQCDGAVLRVFGAGTIPNDPALTAALIAAHARGALMIAVSQAPLGGIKLGSYAAGSALIRSGVVDGRATTFEAAYCKLAHVLSHGPHEMLAADLCGEM
jgi:L-asparaginase